MAAEQEYNSHGWTFDSLHEHFVVLVREKWGAHERDMVSLALLAEQALTSSNKAVEKSEASIDKRLSALNDLKSVMADERATFLTRVEYDSAHTALESQVLALQDRMNRSEGSSVGKGQMWGYAAAAAAVLGTLIVIMNLITSRGV